MGLNRDDVDDLLAAWALDAIDAGRACRGRRGVGRRSRAGTRARALQHTVAALGDVVAESPPPETRMNVLRAAAARGRDSLDPTPALLLFERQVASMTELLVELDDDEWQMRVAPYAWSVHGLMAHLLVIERYMASLVGLVAPPVEGAVDDHLAMGATVIAAELAGASGARSRRGRRRPPTPSLPSGPGRRRSTTGSSSTAGRSRSRPSSSSGRSRCGPMPTTSGGPPARPLQTPPPRDLRAMSMFSVSTSAAARAGRAREGPRPHRAHGSRWRHVRSRRAGLRTYGDAGGRRRRLLPHRGTSHRHRRAAGGHRRRPRPGRGAAHRGPRTRGVIRRPTPDEQPATAQPPHRGDHFDG